MTYIVSSGALNSTHYYAGRTLEIVREVGTREQMCLEHVFER